MGSEWSEFALDERCSVKSSKRIFAREYVEDGIPFMRSKDVIDKSLGSFSYYDLFISRERFKEISSKFGFPQKGDLLINSVGNRSGQPYVVQDEGDFYFKDGNILWLSKFDQIDAYYLAYWFKSRLGQHALETVMIGSAQKALTIDAIRKLVVKFPAIEVQRVVAGVIKSLDDRIELNRQMNETLESMAQALFKSWFVDFDPVIDNALASGKEIPEELREKAQARAALGDKRQPLPVEIRTLFPDEFVYSDELGWIPNGWEVGAIKQLCKKIQNGGTPKRDKSEYWEQGTIPWLTSGEVRQTIITRCENKITSLGLEKSSAKWLLAGATVVALYGATAGQVAFVASDLTTNQAVCGLVPKEDSRFFNYLSLERGVSHLANQASGSAQQNISKGIVEKTQVVIPAGDMLRCFEKQCLPIFDKWVAHLEANEVLANLRDTLLPKLMSGEIRIPDAEKMVEELVL